MFLDPPIFCWRKLCRATAVETQICFDLQGGKFKSYLIPGSSVFTFGLTKLSHLISNVTRLWSQNRNIQVIIPDCCHT